MRFVLLGERDARPGTGCGGGCFVLGGLGVKGCQPVDRMFVSSAFGDPDPCAPTLVIYTLPAGGGERGQLQDTQRQAEFTLTETKPRLFVTRWRGCRSRLLPR